MIKHWLDGIVHTNPNTNNTETGKYWFDGIPYVEIFEITISDPVKKISYTVFANIKKINGIPIANVKKMSNVSI